MSQSRWSVWWLAARPKTLWAAVAPVVIGTAIAVADGKGHWGAAAAALLGAVLIQVGTNFANDYFDFKKGADSYPRLGPTRMTQAGLISPSAMKTAMVVTFALALLGGIYLVWRGGLPIVAIGLLSILLGVLYTGGPYPLGYHGWGDLFVLIFFGPVAVGGSYFVQALEIHSLVLLAGVSPGLFSVAILTVNNLRDIPSDRQAGKKTLAVRWGAGFARFEYVFCVVTAAVMPVFFFLVTRRHPWVCLTLLVLPAAIPSIKKIFHYEDGTELNSVLAATAKLLLFYGLLFSIGWLV